MRGIRFDRVQIPSSHQGVGIDWRGGGNLSDCNFTNLNIHRVGWVGSGPYEDQHWMGNAQPIFVSNDVWPANPDSGRGSIRGLRFENGTLGREGRAGAGLNIKKLCDQPCALSLPSRTHTHSLIHPLLIPPIRTYSPRQ